MDWSLFLVLLAACAAAGATGSMFPPGPWYRALAKPPWTPPDWVFPVAWSYLYLALAFAGARVAPLEASAYAMAFWALQIALNTLWTPVFFGLQKLKAGLVIIVLLWLAVAALLINIWSLDRTAFWVASPYILWVTIAGALNASILMRNPSDASA